MTGITINRRDDRLIAVKGSTPSGADRRYREAQLLARLDHPGVVQFVELIDGETVELHMQYAGADTWEHQPPTDASAIINGLAAVASTIADLHDLGTAHRALVPDHVVIAADGRPVLCGLSDASAADPATTADDLAGLAGLIRHLSPAAPDDLRHSLDDLATRATTGELTARSIAAELNTADQPEPRERKMQSGFATRLALIAGIVGMVTIVAAIGWAIARPSSGSAPASQVVAASQPGQAEQPAQPEQPAVAAAPAELPPADVPVVAESSVDVSPTTDPAIEFIHDGRLYGLGEGGDIAVLGDWNCDGEVTPALLQPATGLVAVFLAWPGPDTSTAPDLSNRFSGALDLAAVEVDGCHQLRVIHPTGSMIFTAEAP